MHTDILQPKLKPRNTETNRMPNRAKEPRASVAPSFKGYVSSSLMASGTKSRNRAKNTKPEICLRRALFTRGARYRLHASGLPGKPDIVFAGAKVAIFVDGDFWHGRNWRARKKLLAEGSNSEYWVAKIGSNRIRDAHHTATLTKLGWRVVRIWESDIRVGVDRQAELVLRVVKSRL